MSARRGVATAKPPITATAPTAPAPVRTARRRRTRRTRPPTSCGSGGAAAWAASALGLRETAQRSREIAVHLPPPSSSTTRIDSSPRAGSAGSTPRVVRSSRFRRTGTASPIPPRCAARPRLRRPVDRRSSGAPRRHAPRVSGSAAPPRRRPRPSPPCRLPRPDRRRRGAPCPATCGAGASGRGRRADGLPDVALGGVHLGHRAGPCKVLTIASWTRSSASRRSTTNRHARRPAPTAALAPSRRAPPASGPPVPLLVDATTRSSGETLGADPAASAGPAAEGCVDPHPEGRTGARAPTRRDVSARTPTCGRSASGRWPARWRATRRRGPPRPRRPAPRRCRPFEMWNTAW